MSIYILTFFIHSIPKVHKPYLVGILVEIHFFADKSSLHMHSWDDNPTKKTYIFCKYFTES